MKNDREMTVVLSAIVAGIVLLTGLGRLCAPSEIDFDAVFVVNGGSNSISVIDAQTDREERTIRLTGVSWPHHIYLSPDQKSMVVAAPGMDLSEGHHGGHVMPGDLVVLDSVTGEVI